MRTAKLALLFLEALDAHAVMCLGFGADLRLPWSYFALLVLPSILRKEKKGIVSGLSRVWHVDEQIGLVCLLVIGRCQTEMDTVVYGCGR